MNFSPKFSAALSYADILHAEQKRKASGTPYIGHLLGVASLVIEYGGTEDEAIAALLHDAVEDQGGEKTRAIIESKFGCDVAAIVMGCSDTTETPKPPYKERKIKHIEHVSEAHASVLMVVAADKLHNLRSIFADYRVKGDNLWPSFKGGKDGTLWYYEGMAHALKCGYMRSCNNVHLERLIEQYERELAEFVIHVQKKDLEQAELARNAESGIDF